MAVNLSKNSSALMAAYEKVVDAKSDTDWALFTYEGNSDNLQLAETGGGGLEELVEELNSGKVMYAFCRVPDPNSDLPKYVLINWTGEGVKASRKGICANHFSAIANFLKGAHVTINARTEDDVEPETILTKVAKASGVNYNFHKQKNYIDAPRGPVGSVFRKVNAAEEIQQTKKDNFWDQAQRDEELRQKEEKKKAEQVRQNVEKERRELDEKQAKERESRTKDSAHQLELEMVLQKNRDEEDTDGEQQQLGSVFRKINAAEEIQQTKKDNFWDEAQRDEELRQNEERKKAEQVRQNVEKERRELDEKQAKERERRTKDSAHQLELEMVLQKNRDEEDRDGRQQQLGSVYRKFKAAEEIKQTKKDNFWIQVQGSVYKKINAAEEIKQSKKDNFWIQVQRDEELRQNEERKKAEQERQNVDKERRELDEKQAKDSERRTKDSAHQLELEMVLQKNRDEEDTDGEQQQLEAKSPISQSAINPGDSFKKKEQSLEANPPSPGTSSPGKFRSTFLSKKSVKPESPLPDDHNPETNPLSSAIPELPSLSAGAFSPTFQEMVTSPEQDAEDNSTEEAEWSDEFDDDADDMTPAESPVLQDLHQSPDPIGTADHLYENICQDKTKDYNNPGDGEKRYKARALYDYQAADATEITFDPDDIITEIEMLDKGWWKGLGPDGIRGLFPSNYVELLND